jgi:Ca-activated chloride channel family protein
MYGDGRYRRRSGGSGAIIIILLVIFFASRTMRDRGGQSPPRSRVSTPVTNPIEDVLRPSSLNVPQRDGVVAAILIDTSGSMQEKVKDANGAMQPKIDIAKRAALSLVDQFDGYAKEHSDKPIMLGIYEFSDRGNRTAPSRRVVALGPPDAAAARSAIVSMRASGDTPIGDAMIMAKRDVDATGLSKRHILVITDGENTRGYSPADVTRVISSQSEKDRASIYFVAFDVAAAKFNKVKDSGGLVLGASNETDLKGTLDYLLTGKILAEQPEH